MKHAGKASDSLAYLILHQSEHRQQQPSVCSYCGKQLSTKDCLRTHMARHTDGCLCSGCGKKFYQKTYLQWHLYKHTGQESYLCDTCGIGMVNFTCFSVQRRGRSSVKTVACVTGGIALDVSPQRQAHQVAGICV